MADTDAPLWVDVSKVWRSQWGQRRRDRRVGGRRRPAEKFRVVFGVEQNDLDHSDDDGQHRDLEKGSIEELSHRQIIHRSGPLHDY